MQPDGRLTAGPRPGLFDSVKPDLARVEQEITEALTDENALVTEIATHLLRGGGKRLRPALVLLVAGMYQADPALARSVAAAVEIIHMATLVHDDAVDRSALRRGVPTVNARWGDDAAILMGDYLFAHAFSKLAQTGNNRVVRIMADVVSRMASGEFEQLTEGYDPSQDEADYIRRIDKKTGYFIAQSCRVGAVLAGADEHEEEALARYGYHIGLGFQIIDDILDFTSSEERLGKPAGSDLRGGILTLPVIHALAHSPQKERLAEMIEARQFTDDDIREVKAILEECGAIEYAGESARRHTRQAKEALQVLPETPGRNILEELADYLVQRDF